MATKPVIFALKGLPVGYQKFLSPAFQDGRRNLLTNLKPIKYSRKKIYGFRAKSLYDMWGIFLFLPLMSRFSPFLLSCSLIDFPTIFFQWVTSTSISALFLHTINQTIHAKFGFGWTILTEKEKYNKYVTRIKYWILLSLWQKTFIQYEEMNIKGWMNINRVEKMKNLVVR